MKCYNPRKTYYGKKIRRMYAKIFNVLPSKEYMILMFVEIILLQYMNYISIKLLQK